MVQGQSVLEFRWSKGAKATAPHFKKKRSELGRKVDGTASEILFIDRMGVEVVQKWWLNGFKGLQMNETDLDIFS